MSRVTINKFNNSVKMFDIYSASVDTILVLVECVCVCVFGAVFMHSSVIGHLDCFHVLAMVNSAAVNVEIHVSFWIRVLSG